MTAHTATKKTLRSPQTQGYLPSLASCLSALAVATTLAACGGGGSGNITTPPVVDRPDPPRMPLPALPLQQAQDSANAPLFYVTHTAADGSIIGRNIHIGAAVQPPPNSLGNAAQHQQVAVSLGRIQDGVPARRLISLLTDDSRNNIPNIPEFPGVHTDRYIARFNETPPTIRVAEDTSPEILSLTSRALQLINAYLPRDWQLRLDPAHFSSARDDADTRNQITLTFAPNTSWPFPGVSPDTAGIARHRTEYSYGPSAEDPVIAYRIHADIWLDHTLLPGTLIDDLVHELLHAIGRTHPTPGLFPGSVMNSPAEYDHTYILFPLDRDALHAVYSRLQPGSTVASLAEDLGPWSHTSTHLLGEFSAGGEDISFGVALRNGLAQPWANGPAPLTDLVNNEQLTGNASWTGRLLGFTPQAQPVAGAAALTVALDTLAGDLQFSDLEQWTDGQTPGPASTGTMWDDGNLSYTVDVRGNTFTRTGGDAGIVTGAFLGTEHQAIGGTLQRDDLTAAFGGSR